MNQLQTVKGIGPKIEKKLNHQNIQTIEDLLFLFPMRYQFDSLNDFTEIERDLELTLKVVVTKKPRIFFIRRNLDKLTIQVKMNNMNFNVNIFNRRFLSKALAPNTEIVITGKFLKNFSNFTASNIVLFKNFNPGIKPIYNIKDISDKTLHKAIQWILSESIILIETLPDEILSKHHIPNINELISKIHLPESEMDIVLARKRIVYEELLEFAIRIETLKKLNQNIKSPKKQYDILRVREFISTLPFELTDDQKQATNDIFRDLKQDRQMNRLLQGDVGSGKTIVSIIASLAVVSSGFQVALMTPTLVLAKQHYKTYQQYFKTQGIRIGLLISELSQGERKQLIKQISNNEIDIVIGTHSLISESVDFHNLGFLIIDEQHRFGVKQRRELRLKGVSPDILLMSATPIPRTLAIAIYNDIDISFIKEKPEGRKEIHTDIVSFEEFDNVLRQIRLELDKGHQAYVICPKIEESEISQKLSVEEIFKLLEMKLPQTYRLGMLHGRLPDQEKTNIIQQFYENDIHILVSTTVIEVGVDVKNATAMLIMSADTFGLAQLHQLRGRIGRDEYQSYCYLMVDDILNASERLKIMKETNDGFLISEYDLKIRGQGEMFGQIQSGVPTFKMANLISDSHILEQALDDATIILSNNDIRSIRLKNKALNAIESYNLD